MQPVILLILFLFQLPFFSDNYYVNDEKCAGKIAEIVFKNLFGDSVVLKQKPFVVEAKELVWVVSGNNYLKKSDRISMHISKKDCAISQIFPLTTSKNSIIEIVPNESTAVYIASTIWQSLFGYEINDFKPYGAILHVDKWIVTGSVNNNKTDTIDKNGQRVLMEGLGGAPYIEIDKRSGRIIDLYRVK